MDAWQSDLDHLSWISSDGLEFKDQKVLDLGCGSGYLCKALKAIGANKSLGLDIVRPSLISSDWDFVECNLDVVGWESSIDDYFDYVFAFDILEHVESPFQLLKSCYQLLEPGGKLVLTTPNTFSWESFVNPEGWSGVRDPQHKTLFSKYSLSFILSKVGFNVKKISAPVRKLGRLGAFSPQIGGQIYCLAEK